MTKNLLFMFAAAAIGVSSIASADVPAEDFSLNFEKIKSTSFEYGKAGVRKAPKPGSAKTLKIRPKGQKKGGLDRDIIRRKW